MKKQKNLKKTREKVKDLTPTERRKWLQKIYARLSSNKSRACLSSK